MKKLTKSQRHIAYILMLVEIEEEHEHYMCNAAKAIGVFEQNTKLSLWEIKKYLPEMYTKKPCKWGGTIIGDQDPWFYMEEKQKRIEILKQCIEETY